MNKKRIRVIVLWATAAIALYALAGFLLLPYTAKRLAVSYVERDLGHRLTLGEVRFNPFTFRAEVADIDLREASGGGLIACRSLSVDFEAASLWRRAWTFADISVHGPHINAELRAGGHHNFGALLAALRNPKPQPDAPPPRLDIRRIAVAEGRVDLADLPAGEAARLTLAPIAFELTELTTEASDSAPYKLNARSADGERIQWNGEVSLNPAASKGRFALQGWNATTLQRWLGNRIALDRAAGSLDLAFDYYASYTDAAVAFTVSNLEGRIAGLELTGRNAAKPFAALGALQFSGGAFDLAARKAAIERVEIKQAALALELDAEGSGNWSGVIPRLQGEAQPLAAVERGDPPAPQPQSTEAAAAGAPWSGRIGRLVVADSAFSYADRNPAAPAEIALTGVAFETAAEATHSISADAIALSNTQAAIGTLAARMGAQQLDATETAMSASAVSAKLGGGAIELDARAISAGLAALGLRQGKDDWQVGKLAAGVETLRLAIAAGAKIGADAAALSLEASAIAARGGNNATKIVELGSAGVRARTIALAPGERASNLRIGGLDASIGTATLRDPANGGELARMTRAELGGAAASIADRTLTIEKLALSEIHAAAVLGTDGKLNWDAFLAHFGVDRAAPADKKQVPDAAPWKALVRSVELINLSAAFTDRRQDPALTVELQQINARARNASSDRAAAMQVRADGRIKDGGQFAAAGAVNPHTLATDLKVKLSGLSLAALQPYAARYARVQIVSALASGDGRLRYGFTKAAGADLVFEGDLGLDKVIVEETEPAQPLLSIETLRAVQAKLTLGPDRVEIPDLRLDKLSTRLLIGEDQSVNIVKLLRPRPQSQPATAPPAKPDAGDAADPFPVVISRVRLNDSVLEFSDLSLRPQFNARMHELQGVITGIATSPDTRARMELDARVDEFGSAQIRGIMNLFKPHVFTNVTMSFRNLEMTSLSPYAAKFAGYRIASGKLTMDLQYRIKNSALVGENKIVVDKLELGERVESPSALDLPLELAIAILKDENGRIDIGLPVSGSLDDPQFSIAALVWKAIGNLLGRIVTAPFRALGRLFGGGESENLNAIEFDPGIARLAPPERQKLQTVAEALAKRPELKLTVKPAYAPKTDREALQSIGLRREVLARAGIKLDADEAPGPLDYGNSRIRSAVENLFTEAFGFPAARDLRADLAKRAPRPGGAAATVAKPAERPGADAAPPQPDPQTTGDAKSPAKPPEASNVRVARAMTRRLVEARPVEDAALADLAQRRGTTIATALSAADKLDASRITTAAPRAADDGEPGRSVATTLELGVAK